MGAPLGAMAQASDSGTGSNAGVITPIRAIEPTPSGRQPCEEAPAAEARYGSISAAPPTAVTPRKCLRFIRSLPPPLVVRPTFRFSGGALPYVPCHFIHHRPLQPVVMRLAH